MKPLLLCLLTLLVFSGLSAADMHRFALFIGADNGGTGRTTLRYAVTDAQALKSVLTELGGLSNDNAVVLGNPDRASVLKSLASFAPRVAQGKQDGDRAEFLFYYSGHSDEDGLLLGNTRIGYGELREALARVGADVRLAVLDSCASGAFTRLKGGTKAAPFLQDESSSLEGHAYLTSSSEDEASQESDKIGGSFFTHYLISGLRGAADATGDGRVSLNEAYRHAFDETLARTEDTQSGPQHPSYDIQLSGTGDLVLTDLTRKTSRLVLAADVSGQVFVRTAAGALVAEVRKTLGETLTLAVPAGTYDVALQASGGYGQTRRPVASGQAVNVSASDLVLGSKQATRARGTDGGEDDPLMFNIGLVPWVELFRAEGRDTKLTLFYILSITRDTLAIQASGVGNLARNVLGFQGAGVFNIANGNTQGFQGAGVFNLANGNVQGFQGAGIFNIANGNTSGFQGAGIFNITNGSDRGFQGGGIFNIANGEVSGFQGAGIFNRAGDLRGFQGAGIVNIAGNVTGVQAAGIVNVAQNVKGFQVGLVNIAHHVDGMAVGLVNIADNSFGRIGMDFDNRGGQWTTLEWGAGSLHNVLIAPPGTPLFGSFGDVGSTTSSWGYSLGGGKPFGAGLGLQWGKELQLETQAIAFFNSGRGGLGMFVLQGETTQGFVAPAFRAVLNAKLGFLGIHAGWLGTAHFPGYTPESDLVGGPDTFTTELFTPGYEWQVTGRPFIGASVGF